MPKSSCVVTYLFLYLFWTSQITKKLNRIESLDFAFLCEHIETVYCTLKYVYCTLTEVFLNLTEVSLHLTELYPSFFLSCKTNPRIKLAKDEARPAPFHISCYCVVRLLFVLCYELFVCNATGWQTNCS